MRNLLSSLIVIVFIGLVLPVPVGSESIQKEIEKAGPKAIVIRSNTLEMDNKQKVVVFKGDVNAEKDDFVITCEKMLVYYENSPAEKEAGDLGTSIKKIIAIGHVIIKRAQGGVATADKAVYYQQDEKMVLTGRPLVKQGNDFVEGDIITTFLKEDRVVVESSGEKRVKAMIFPKQEER